MGLEGGVLLCSYVILLCKLARRLVGLYVCMHTYSPCRVLLYIQWNLSNQDIIGSNKSVKCPHFGGG